MRLMGSLSSYFLMSCVTISEMVLRVLVACSCWVFLEGAAYFMQLVIVFVEWV